MSLFYKKYLIYPYIAIKTRNYCKVPEMRPFEGITQLEWNYLPLKKDPLWN